MSQTTLHEAQSVSLLAQNHLHGRQTSLREARTQLFTRKCFCSNRKAFRAQRGYKNIVILRISDEIRPIISII